MTGRITTVEQRPDRRRGARRPLRSSRQRHPEQPQRPHDLAAGQIRMDAWSSLDRLVTAAEADMIQRWRQARATEPAERAQALAAFVLEVNHSMTRRGIARYRLRRLASGDVEQAARLGLLKAMDRFDPTAGTPFGIYASYWVRKEAQRALAAGEFPIAIPAHLGGRLLAVVSLSRTEARPDARSLGKRLGVGESVAAGLARVAEGTDVVEDLPDWRQGTEEWVTVQAIHDSLNLLGDDLRPVVVARFGFDGAGPRSGRQVARELSISEFTVRSRLRRALSILERHLRDC